MSAWQSTGPHRYYSEGDFVFWQMVEAMDEVHIEALLAAVDAALRQFQRSVLLVDCSQATILKPEARRRYAAAEALCRTDELEPRAWLLTQRGDLELRAGRDSAARVVFESALRLAPDYPVAQQRLAAYFEGNERWVEAEPWLARSVRHTRSPELLLRLATVEEHMGRAARADSLRSEALYHMEHHYLAGDFGHLRTLARQLIDRPAGPRDLARGLAMARQDAAARAGVYAEWTLARALRLNGRPGEALTHANRAVRLGTPEADFWLERAACQDALGLVDDARLSRRVAGRINPRAERRFVAGPVPRVDGPTS
jgi:tetratricopeptide (TPR) repeat protein